MKGKIRKKWIIFTLLFCLILLIVPEYLSAEQSSRKIENKINIFSYSISFSEDDFHFDNVLGYTKINYEENSQLNEIGSPQLPVKNILVALPDNIKATTVRIINKESKNFSGSFQILPARPPQKLNNLKENLVITIKDSIYQSHEQYPAKTVELIKQTDLAGQSIAVISLYPIHYIPKTNTLKLNSQIDFVIEGVKGYNCKDFLTDKISENSKIMYGKTIKEMVVNPEDVELRYKNCIEKTGVEAGNYEYVIITNSSWVDSFQPLADWKTKKGVPAKIVTTDWIYNNGNYSGSAKEKIRSFVMDAHSNWGTIYFLLGGDTNYIPYHTAYYQGDDIPTDTYYSDYDDDWSCEVYIGRASVNQIGSGSGGIETFVNKSLNYEKNPALTNFTKNVALFGFDLNSFTDGEDCKMDIDDLYIPSNWSITAVYDSHTGNHEDNVDQAVNNGQNIINHIDHSNYNYMGTGYINHDWGLINSEVDAFSNGEKQSTWYSIGCWASAYDYDNCIAEHFVRDINGGGVAFIGNSRYGWYQPGYDDYASLRYDRYFFKSFFNENHYRLGDLFSDHKMDAYNSMSQDDYNKYIFTELTLLGDPELPLWKENPLTFNATFPEFLPLGNSSFKVHVETSTGAIVNNSYVCLLKNDEVYLTNYTNNYGNVTFHPSPLTTGWLNITVTKQNFIPFEGESEVVQLNYPPLKPSNPDPEDGSTGVSINANLSWTGGDPDGDPVSYDVYFGTTNPPPLVVNNQTSESFPPGTMEYNTTYFWKIIAWDNSSESNESTIWDFTTEKVTNNPPYPASDPNPENGSINVCINDDLFWSGEDQDGDSITFDVYFGVNSIPPQVSNNQSIENYDPGMMNLNTTYYWQIVTWDTQGDSTKSPIWCFATESNSPPSAPDISGPNSGRIGTSYEYKFVSNDPNGHDIYYYIKWGDDDEIVWIGPYLSGEEVELSHIWNEIGSFVITAKAKDELNASSNWGYLEVIMPKNKILFFGFEIIKNLIEKYPNAFPIISQLLK